MLLLFLFKLFMRKIQSGMHLNACSRCKKQATFLGQIISTSKD